MTNQFTWIDIYQELATTLLTWENRQTELIDFLGNLHNQGFTVISMRDKNRDDERFLLEEIDPFSFFSSFNRQIKDENRIAILAKIKQHFNLESPLPSDFKGIPVVNNQSSWFFAYHSLRKPTDIPRLWHLFKLALQENPFQNPEFLKAFDEALKVRRVNTNLTMGLFWIRPYTFLGLDSQNRAYLNIALPKGGLTATFYVDIVQSIAMRAQSFPELSLMAWKTGQENRRNSETKGNTVTESLADKDVTYWLVGAYWDDRDPPDQTDHFLEEGLWQNGYLDRYLDDVKAMKVNDKIAIKAATTQRKNLPFDAQGRTVSLMIIKAIGTVVANRGDGQTVEVEWESDFQEKLWYFFTNRSTVWRLKTESDYQFKEYSEKLIEFIWGKQKQDYEWFIKQWWQDQSASETSVSQAADSSNLPYSVEDIISAGVFLEEDELRLILNRLRAKKAMILQGAPGVGKTFLAQKLAYALMEELDKTRLEMVQFHQSYAYDDFVQGYRPQPGKAGGFALKNGVFYQFCQKAAQDPDREYVFIIDEINRGNLSQIFGELLMLLEADKRGPEFAVHLVYRDEDESSFYIPSNVYVIGLMNIADRSLAMVDYALRRRFAFITLQPQYSSKLYRQWLLDRLMSETMVNSITSQMDQLNQTIKDDPLLGENYQIGHSYFCPKGDNFASLDEAWFVSILQTEILPLLKEYWFDNPQRADEAIRKLLNY
jgi:5-methylcytosine-specific restriction protein B